MSRMNPYRYKISLRLRHPSLDPQEITRTLRLAPSRSWQAGGKRATPKGGPLQGTYRETYWTTALIERGSDSQGLPDAIGALLGQLHPYRDFFHRVHSEGGATEFFVGWFFEGQSGDVFDCNLLARMADLKISLSLDVYGAPSAP